MESIKNVNFIITALSKRLDRSRQIQKYVVAPIKLTKLNEMVRKFIIVLYIFFLIYLKKKICIEMKKTRHTCLKLGNGKDDDDDEYAIFDNHKTQFAE